MDRFRQLETFIAVAENGGFNSAAKQLNLSPPSVTRLISTLEERIGIRLFTRTTRHVSLTEAGQTFLVDAVRVLEDLDTIEAMAKGAETEPQGILSVTAPVVFGHRYIAPIVRDFVDANPKVTARTFFADRVVNMVEEGFDAALRVGELPDSSLRAIRVGTLRWVTVAAPSYLKKHSAPEVPRDVTQHRTIQVSDSQAELTLHFSVDGKRKGIPVQPALRCNTIAATIDAALAGWGITRALSYQVADHLKSGKLVEVLSEFDDREVPIHLLHAEGRLASAKIRNFVDFAAKVLRDQAKFLAAT